MGISKLIIILLALLLFFDKSENKDSNFSEDYIRTCFEKSVFYLGINNDSSYYYIEKTIRLSEQSGNEKGIFMGNYAKFEYYIQQEDWVKAVTHVRAFINFADKATREKIWLKLGNIYFYNDLFDISKDYYQRAMKSEDNLVKASSMSNLGSIYIEQHRTDSAFAYLEEALNIFMTQEENSPEIEQNIAITKLNLARIFITKGNLQTAMDLLQDNEFFFIKTKDDYNLALTYNGFADCYLQQGNIQEASSFFEKACIITDTLNAYYLKVIIYPKMSEFQQKKGRVKKALHYLMLSYSANLSQLQVRNELVALYVNEKMNEKKDYQNMSIWSGLFWKYFFFIMAGLLLGTFIILIKRRKKQKTTIREKNDGNEPMLTEPIYSPGSAEYENYSELRKMKIITEDDIHRFTELFIELHSEYYYKVKMNYRFLSGGDMLQMMFLKLEMTNKDASAKLGISVEGVKRAKQRLSKKLDLDSTRGLKEFISRI